MKKVFNNSAMVAHVWAQQSQNEGRNSGSSSFYNTKMYSYAALIAEFVTPEIVIFNKHRYSNTTADHQSDILNALHGVTIFKVDNRTNDLKCHAVNIQSYINDILHNEQKAVKAREQKENYLIAANNYKKELNKYLSTFANDFNSSHAEILKEANKYAEISQETNEAIKEAIIKDNKRKQAAKNKADKEAKQRLNAWLKGETSYTLYGLKNTRLRVSNDGETIQTTQGAQIGIKTARLLFEAIKSKRDIVGMHVESFTVKAMDKKTITIGCHVIEFKEINRISGLLNWN